MTSEAEVRDLLRAWVMKSAVKGKRKAYAAGQETLADTTLLVEERVISSLKLMELLLYIEELRGSPIDMSTVGAGMLSSIDVIYKTFFPGAANGK